MEENKKSWGGARQGAGRRITGTGKRITVSYRIDPESKAKFVQTSEELGISNGDLLDRLAKAIDIIGIDKLRVL